MAMIAGAERLNEIQTHQFPSNLRRRYDRLRWFPVGLLVIGDALCSFNPIYGQGMTVAAMEAVALRQSLVSSGPEELAPQFFKAAARHSGVAWQLSTWGRPRYPHRRGAPRPMQVRAMNAYVGRIQAAAEQDAVVASTFMRVTALLSTRRPG